MVPPVVKVPPVILSWAAVLTVSTPNVALFVNPPTPTLRIPLAPPPTVKVLAVVPSIVTLSAFAVRALGIVTVCVPVILTSSEAPGTVPASHVVPTSQFVFAMELNML